MPDTEIFSEVKNKIDDLTITQQEELAQETARLFLDSTDQIQHMIDDSLVAWDYFHNSEPRHDFKRSFATKQDGADVRRQLSNARLGDIPVAVNSILAFLHNSTFPSDERFFRATPLNDIAAENQDSYEVFLSENMGEVNTIEELIEQIAADIKLGRAILKRHRVEQARQIA